MFIDPAVLRRGEPPFKITVPMLVPTEVETTDPEVIREYLAKGFCGMGEKFRNMFVYSCPSDPAPQLSFFDDLVSTLSVVIKWMFIILAVLVALVLFMGVLAFITEKLPLPPTANNRRTSTGAQRYEPVSTRGEDTTEQRDGDAGVELQPTAPDRLPPPSYQQPSGQQPIQAS